jgi:2-polyprenyl-3-methyl-5-hydroxy-6-metoxy-1,4-benzoquinol methylase
MKIKDVIKYSVKPDLYAKGTSKMWTDDYISKQLLNVHLNTEIDLASRKKTTIESTAKWVLENANNKQLNILDLGCGPGLYTELFAKNGHKITGIDFSKNSIDYAKNESEKKKLNIEYKNADYLQIDLEENRFDLVTLIFTDFGVLLPDERDKLLSFISKVLRPNGVFIFDVLNTNNINEKTAPRNWEVAEHGFWRDKPYLVLSDSFHYEKDNVILYQHTVIDENDNIDVYRFWTHFFSNSDLTEILKDHGFNQLSFHEDVLPKGDLWSGDNVTFCKASKK